MERAGRISHMTAAVVVGNGKGAVGFGYGKVSGCLFCLLCVCVYVSHFFLLFVCYFKAKKRREAVIDATIKALQRMIPVDRYNDHTVFQVPNTIERTPCLVFCLCVCSDSMFVFVLAPLSFCFFFLC